jgi:hypothetical protein
LSILESGGSLHNIIKSYKETENSINETFPDFLISWLFRLLKSNHQLGNSFRQPIISPILERYFIKDTLFFIGKKIDILNHLIFFGPHPPNIIQKYIGMENVVFDEIHYRDLLHLKIQTIGHVLFSTENSNFKWNRSSVASSQIFGLLEDEYKNYKEGPSNRTIRDALKSIVPENCVKRGNREFTKFTNKEINQVPCLPPKIIFFANGKTKINFFLISILVNCVITTRSMQLSKERHLLCPKELLDLPILQQIYQFLNQKEKEIFLYGLQTLLKKRLHFANASD